MDKRANCLDGKIALVTGAGRRLGRAIALALAEGGADLLLHVHASSGEEVRRCVEEMGRRALVLEADLSLRGGTLQLVQAASAAFGRIDILVNNAAVFFPTPLTEISIHTWRTVLHTNLTAPFVLSVGLGRFMRRQKEGGAIIQLADWSGIRPVPGFLPYCVSKGGGLALTQVLAKALAPYVKVNAIAPGPVLPPAHYDEPALHTLVHRTPLRRLGREQDVTRVVCFLANPGNFVTGATYLVEGGWLAGVGGGSDTSL